MQKSAAQKKVAHDTHIMCNLTNYMVVFPYVTNYIAGHI